jgi:hypothetical protein
VTGERFSEAEWARALAMPDPEFACFVRAQKLYREHPAMSADDPFMEQVFDALAGAGLVMPSVTETGQKAFELTENHTTSFIAALTARAEQEGRLR